MKKQIIAISLTCSCLLNASWIDDAKAKVNSAVDTAKEKTSILVDNAKGKYSKYNEDKAKKKEAKLNKCISDIEQTLPTYALFLEQNYISSTKPIETKILNNYIKLKNKGISKELSKYLSHETLEKLSNSTSNIEYMSIVISELKKLQKEFKKNDKTVLSNLIKQTQYLMYAWTTPMEILSSQKIYDNSLLGLSSAFYNKINKDTYKNYNKFVYSMLFANLINENIVIPKDSSLKGSAKVYGAYITFGTSLLLTGIPNNKDKKGLKTICEDITNQIINNSTADEYIQKNIATSLNIDKDKLAKIIKDIPNNKHLFQSAIFLNKDIKTYKEVNIINNPLNDSWYLMIREYMELQDNFYQAKKEVDKIIKILAILPNTEKEIAILKQSTFNVDGLYRKFDEIVRFNIIDLPLSIYADLYSIQVKKAKQWYDDDEDKITDIAVAYNKSCANMQKYLSSEFATLRVMNTMKVIKKELNEDEFKVAKTRAKLTQDWLNMLNKVKIQNK
jgi:hypothetical protein